MTLRLSDTVFFCTPRAFDTVCILSILYIELLKMNLDTNSNIGSMGFSQILPVFHNLKYSMVQQREYFRPIFQSCPAISFSLRDPEAAYSASIALNDRIHNGCAVGLSSLVSEEQVSIRNLCIVNNSYNINLNTIFIDKRF